MRALGLPLQRNRGPELSQSEVFRYLAEIAWAPPAIVANHQLQWRELDERTVELATPVTGEPIAVRLTFNEAGEITQTVAWRPRLESGNAPTPWIGDFADYRDVGSVRVPTRCEVRWELPDGPLTTGAARSHHFSCATDVGPSETPEPSRTCLRVATVTGETSCLSLVWAVLDLFFSHASNGATFTDVDRQHLYRIKYQQADPRHHRRGGHRRLDSTPGTCTARESTVSRTGFDGDWVCRAVLDSSCLSE